MNNIAFLQLVTSIYGIVSLDYDTITSVATVSANGQTWKGATLDQAITDMKQTFAIKYLEQQR